jgi:hypothetical protein
MGIIGLTAGSADTTTGIRCPHPLPGTYERPCVGPIQYSALINDYRSESLPEHHFGTAYHLINDAGGGAHQSLGLTDRFIAGRVGLRAPFVKLLACPSSRCLLSVETECRCQTVMRYQCRNGTERWDNSHMKTLANALREQMEAKGVSAKALARLAGVNET